MNEYFSNTNAENRSNNLYRVFATSCDISKLAGQIAANKSASDRIFYLKDFASTESKLA